MKQRALPCGLVVCKFKLLHLHSLAWDRDEALSKLSQMQMQLQDELHQHVCEGIQTMHAQSHAPNKVHPLPDENSEVITNQ